MAWSTVWRARQPQGKGKGNVSHSLIKWPELTAHNEPQALPSSTVAVAAFKQPLIKLLTQLVFFYKHFLKQFRLSTLSASQGTMAAPPRNQSYNLTVTSLPYPLCYTATSCLSVHQTEKSHSFISFLFSLPLLKSLF